MNSKAKAKVQAFGAFLSGMVMPNIGAFIAWGLITALFMKTGWFPNEHLDALRQPMLTYMLPSLMAYTGGKTIYGTRGAVISLIATFGAIVSADVPMFIGAMVVGPIAAILLKKFDKLLEGKIPSGFEMLINNFSLGILGMLFAICAYLLLGPAIAWLNDFFRGCVQILVDKSLLFLMPIFTEPARMLFLNNAISQGIMNPMGIQDAAEAGKSVFFLLSSNPGPGLGLLLAYSFFGKGAAKENAPTATIIHFLGGIHEVYFPYILMKPIMIISTIVGWMASNFFFNIVNAGLVAYPSPGSIISYMLMAPMGEHIKVLAGVALGAVISFVIASFLLKMDKSEEITQDQFDAAVALKDELKGKKKEVNGKEESTEVLLKNVKLIVFACDAGMGSSAMGASVLRNKIKKAGLNIEVTNKAVEDIPVDQADIVVCHESLADRARKITNRAKFVTITNFVNAPEYDALVEELLKNR
ncbi:MAG: PTS mannitol transporter subunit IICB [Bacillus sp. (in: firmicutes)]